jgi:hypothetical protein
MGAAPAGRVLTANKTKVTQPEARKEGPEKPPDTPDALLPPFDLSDAAVCEMINRPLPEDAQ